MKTTTYEVKLSNFDITEMMKELIFLRRENDQLKTRIQTLGEITKITDQEELDSLRKANHKKTRAMAYAERQKRKIDKLKAKIDVYEKNLEVHEAVVEADEGMVASGKQAPKMRTARDIEEIEL